MSEPKVQDILLERHFPSDRKRFRQIEVFKGVNAITEAIVISRILGIRSERRGERHERYTYASVQRVGFDERFRQVLFTAKQGRGMDYLASKIKDRMGLTDEQTKLLRGELYGAYSTALLSVLNLDEQRKKSFSVSEAKIIGLRAIEHANVQANALLAHPEVGPVVSEYQKRFSAPKGF